MSDKLYIDGRLVTERNASRFVKARRPNATVSRQRTSGWRSRTYHIVRDRSADTPRWCNADAPTAGAAWLKVARQMIEHDARVTAERKAMALAEQSLLTADNDADLRALALRYAAVRLEQDRNLAPFANRMDCIEALRTMAEAKS
ncbi:MAG TPA: hypothetical protein VFQ42_22100 [Mycobacterium sp.]|nr:hypothetical protein [Mycobacterium sp.]